MKEQQTEQSFWIQKQAPDGNFVDHTGFPYGWTREQVMAKFKEQIEFNTENTFRLILRTDTVIS